MAGENWVFFSRDFGDMCVCVREIKREREERNNAIKETAKSQLKTHQILSLSLLSIYLFIF